MEQNKNSFLDALTEFVTEEVLCNFADDYEDYNEGMKQIPWYVKRNLRDKESMDEEFYDYWRDRIKKDVEEFMNDCDNNYSKLNILGRKIQNSGNQGLMNEFCNMTLYDLMLNLDSIGVNETYFQLLRRAEGKENKSVCRGTKDDGLGSYEDLKKHNLINTTNIFSIVDDDPDWKISEEEKQQLLKESYEWFKGKKDDKREKCFG